MVFLEWLTRHRFHLLFFGSVLGILLVLGYLRPEDYSSSRSKDVVLTDESGNFHLDNSTHPNITNTALVDNPPEIVNVTVELDNNATTPQPELEKASSSSWTFTYPNLGPSLGVVVDRTESDDFKKWAAAFFPHATPPLSSRDIFLQKIIGTGPYPVCRQESDPLDFSAGWLERSITYLYHSNKSRVDCKPYAHPDQPKLSVIEGSALNEHLNNSTGKKTCTVVFFFARSCPYSRRAAPLMHSAAKYFTALHFVAINTDKYPSVAGHYGIMGVPVIVLFQERKFLTGWTIPYPDARDTIRAFIMAYTDAKYWPSRINITDLDTGIISYFRLEKENNALYMLSYMILLCSFILYFWKNFLLDLIKKSLDQAGLNDERLILGVEQPQLPMDPQIPIPVLEL